MPITAIRIRKLQILPYFDKKNQLQTMIQQIQEYGQAQLKSTATIINTFHNSLFGRSELLRVVSQCQNRYFNKNRQIFNSQLNQYTKHKRIVIFSSVFLLFPIVILVIFGLIYKLKQISIFLEDPLEVNGTAYDYYCLFVNIVTKQSEISIQKYFHGMSLITIFISFGFCVAFGLWTKRLIQ